MGITRQTSVPPSYYADKDEHLRLISDYARNLGEDAMRGYSSTFLPAHALIVDAGVPPAFDATIPGYLFDAATLERVAGVFQFPRSWERSNEVHFRVHWTKTTSAAGNVRWKLRRRNASVGAVIDAAWTDDASVTLTTTDNNLADEHLITEFTSLAVGSLRPGDSLLFHIERDAADAADTYAADARLLGVDVIYYAELLGSQGVDSP